MSGLLMTRFDHTRPAAERTGWTHPVDAFMLMLRIWQSRRALLDLTPRELSDIGVSRATAIAEASRLPWDIGPMADRR
nr:DUF1127 domain-containing protein [uncultured Rhodopila sp.]